MRINYNVSAMLSNNALANNDNLLSQSLERLSSGLKINHAKDNPSGLAMARRMNAQIAGLDIASQNANDGVSIIETADGALNEVSDMLQRMNELSIKASNGILSDGDREIIQDEIDQLKEEITRVSETTEFNGQKLLNGEFGLKAYIKGNLDVKVNYYSKSVATKDYTIPSIQIEKEKVDGKETGDYRATANLGPEFPPECKVTSDGTLVTIKGKDGFEMSLDISRMDFSQVDSITLNNLTINATGIGNMRLQIGSNEGQVLGLDIPAVSLKNMGITNLDVSTKDGALSAISSIDKAISYLTDVRGRLGAYQNRLESTVENLDNTSENMTSAYSRIMDVDMAEEMTQYTTYQVVTQAGTSMLAQANERPSQVLQLLQ